MKILSDAQTREADAFTIERRKLAPGELMERAATAFTNWFVSKYSAEKIVAVFCGPGNNGGDGLAIARWLHHMSYAVQVFLPQTDSVFSSDFNLNLERLPPEIPVTKFTSVTGLPSFFPGNATVIDALFGSGLNRPLSGVYAETVAFLNNSDAEIIAVDIPSGLYSDAATPPEAPIIKATHTISFELPKLVFMLPEASQFIGNWHNVPIGLSPEFIEAETVRHYFTTASDIQKMFRPRSKFSHKGTFGHALLMAGSYGKMGAATLSVNACLRSGAGLVSTAIPEVGYTIMQLAAPEAMAIPDKNPHYLTTFPLETEKYAAIGIGPGIGQEAETNKLVGRLLEETKTPLILDADVLNILGSDKQLLQKLPPETILTPHLKEFERLTKPAQNDFHRLELLQEFCERYRCYVVLKGAHSCIGTPSGNLHFNPTGNAGMATGGSGDVLTGILTALRAQGYSALETCLLGVYIHGRAGDLAKQKSGETALIAGDIISNLGEAFRELEES